MFMWSLGHPITLGHPEPFFVGPLLDRATALEQRTVLLAEVLQPVGRAEELPRRWVRLTEDCQLRFAWAPII